MTTHSDESLKAAALLMARLGGCNCDVYVELERTDEPLISHAHVCHDDWCALLNARNAQAN